ncbi:MAG: lytic transglycosylase domain-containing protein [Pyrinomonadaceae bacterium]|nr:lytic transglycosylase domain-containing protein [Pyrinomonadaceae bacterium]
MTHALIALRLFSLCAALLLCGSLFTAPAQKRSKKRLLKAAEQSESSKDQLPQLAEGQVRLKLSDGTLVAVDDAWESEQGIWYKQRGITHLLPRDRVKSVVRGSAVKPKTEQTAKVTDLAPAQTTTAQQPVWIHLVGGARVEVDSATESAAGVWYNRGPLSIFIERSRIDHIERESLETLASDSSAKKARGWSTGRPKIDALIRHSGAKHGVDPYLIFCVMEQESHFNIHALSPKGAQGLMQLMPGTGARFGVRRPFDPAQNIAGGTRFLKQLLQRFNGRVDLVLASYNAGEGAVAKFGGRVPPYRETRNYVKRVGYRYRQVKSSVRSVPPTTPGVGGM